MEPYFLTYHYLSIFEIFMFLLENSKHGIYKNNLCFFCVNKVASLNQFSFGRILKAKENFGGRCYDIPRTFYEILK